MKAVIFLYYLDLVLNCSINFYGCWMFTALGCPKTFEDLENHSDLSKLKDVCEALAPFLKK